MKGASAEVAIWSFFSRRALYFHHAKNQPPLRPPSTFSEHWPKFWEYLLSEKFMKFFWYKIWVATIPKNAKFLVWWVYWRRNKGLVLPTFCTLENPLTLLTNCAMWQCPIQLKPFLPWNFLLPLHYPSIVQTSRIPITPDIPGYQQQCKLQSAKSLLWLFPGCI